MGKVIFAEDVCKGCGLCTTVCPVGIVVMDETRLNAQGYHPATVTDAEKCTGCGSCALICPDSVITVQRLVKEASRG